MGKRDTARERTEAAHAIVGGQLRAMFDKVASQPIPEPLLELVDALEEKRRREELRDPEI
jgi:anti-sigma factor ChrR (cupin superfamily)